MLAVYSAFMLVLITADALTRYLKFRHQFDALTPGELARLTDSLDSCPSYKTPLGRIYLADGAFYYTGGMILPYSDIEEIELRESETDKINVHHIYIHCRDGKRRYIPSKPHALPKGFDEELHRRNSGIKVTRTFKPAFGKKQKQGDKYNEK